MQFVVAIILLVFFLLLMRRTLRGLSQLISVASSRAEDRRATDRRDAIQKPPQFGKFRKGATMKENSLKYEEYEERGEVQRRRMDLVLKIALIAVGTIAMAMGILALLGVGIYVLIPVLLRIAVAAMPLILIVMIWYAMFLVLRR